MTTETDTDLIGRTPMATDPLAVERMLTKNERRRLGRYACGWCDMPLDHEGCGALYERCSEETRRARRERCLSEYKPRIIAELGGDAA